MSDDVVLLAGILVEHEKAGVWSRVPNLTSIGAVGEMAEPKEKTNLENRTKRYGSGMRDAPDKSIKGQFIPPQKSGDEWEADRDLQQDFIKRCKAQEEFPIRITYPDRERAQFTMKILGYEVDDGNQESWKMFTANGKQNTVPVWTEATEMTGVQIAGLATVTVGSTITLVATAAPTDAYYAPGVTWTVNDSSIGSVSQIGVVTGIKAGALEVTATMSDGLNDYTITKDITVS